MNIDLPAAITRSASRQTYLTIRYLADHSRMEDAYRAYAYFRWVDDSLDGNSSADRKVFLARQQSLLNACYHGEACRDASPEEQMLVDLVSQDLAPSTGLHLYLHNMMAVMAFDAARRGRPVTQLELSQYTHLLASAVTEAMHYFIGHNCCSPSDETRYLAVTAAHITHMLRDTLEDVHAGYYNIPLEVLQEYHISPQDVHAPAYRAWVKGRLQLARRYFSAGRSYLRRVPNLRCRLAGFAYTTRFEAVLDAIEQHEYFLQPAYESVHSFGQDWKMYWLALSASLAHGVSLSSPAALGMSRLERRS